MTIASRYCWDRWYFACTPASKDFRIDVWEAQMTAFRETVKTNGPSPLPPEGVLLTNVIMDGIFRSHASRKEVAVKVPEM